MITSTAKTRWRRAHGVLKEHILPSIVACTVILMYFGDDSSNLPFLSIPDRLDLKKRGTFGKQYLSVSRWRLLVCGFWCCASPDEPLLGTLKATAYLSAVAIPPVGAP